MMLRVLNKFYINICDQSSHNFLTLTLSSSKPQRRLSEKEEKCMEKDLVMAETARLVERAEKQLSTDK